MSKCKRCGLLKNDLDPPYFHKNCDEDLPTWVDEEPPQDDPVLAHFGIPQTLDAFEAWREENIRLGRENFLTTKSSRSRI